MADKRKKRKKSKTKTWSDTPLGVQIYTGNS